MCGRLYEPLPAKLMKGATPARSIVPCTGRPSPLSSTARCCVSTVPSTNTPTLSVK
jgi:hypothetical protein